MREEIYHKFCEILGSGRVRSEEPMAEHTTFRIGGPADYYLCPESGAEICRILEVCREEGLPWFILGNGSNLLVGDKGYRGVVIRLGGEFCRVEVDGCRVRAGAAAMLASAAKAAMEHSLTGMEFASGIPGSVGGGVRMNAGAYGGEMSRIVECVEVMYKDGSILELDNETMEFGYRKSVLKTRPYVILQVTLKLMEGDRETIAASMKELAAQRRARQPLEYASAGSTFKRPEGYYAGKLIMDAGLRGARIGGAQVADKHCGFLINDGTATAADIAELIQEVIEKVKERFGVELEPEVIFLGDF